MSRLPYIVFTILWLSGGFALAQESTTTEESATQEEKSVPDGDAKPDDKKDKGAVKKGESDKDKKDAKKDEKKKDEKKKEGEAAVPEEGADAKPDEPKAEEAPAPAAEPKAEAAPAPAAEPKAEEVPAAEPKADETPVVESKDEPAVEPKADETPVVDSKDEPVAEPKAEEVPAEEPKVEAAVGFEEIKATDADKVEGVVENAGDLKKDKKVLLAEEDQLAKKPYGVQVAMEHSLGTGNFVSNDYASEMSDYFGQSWSATGYYNFETMGHKLRASGRASFGLTLSTPTSNPARRFDPGAVSFALSDRKLYKDELTGIRVSGSLSLALPTTYNSYVSRKWLGASARLGASRAVGPVFLRYGFGLSKGFHSSYIPVRDVDSSSVRSDYDVPTSAMEMNDPVGLSSGFANTNFRISNSVAASYQIIDVLSVSYSLNHMLSWKYELFDGTDEYSSTNANNDGPDSSMFSYGIDLSYALTDHLGDMLDLPVRLDVSGGLAAAHSVQTADQNSIMWPVFYQAMAENRAAMNMAVFYLSLAGTY
ncbi:hypothetical protein KAI87_07710 [Myxococcota bacterium]|nr:hypothetical protein [Myxococcota bacterium]